MTPPLKLVSFASVSLPIRKGRGGPKASYSKSLIIGDGDPAMLLRLDRALRADASVQGLPPASQDALVRRISDALAHAPLTRRAIKRADPGGRGNRPRYDCAIMLAVCAHALKTATGKRAPLWDRSDGQKIDSSKAVQVARIALGVALNLKGSYRSSLRRQILAAKGLLKDRRTCLD